MPQHYFHLQGLTFGALGDTVLASYVLSTLALAVIVWEGFRLKTYGMPPLGIISMLSVCLICIIGPFSGQSHLFYSRTNHGLLATWALDAALLAVIFGQYLAYGPRHVSLLRQHVDKFHWFAWLEFAVVALGFWSFIVYYQDYYVNEACPIAILIMTAGFVASIYMRGDLKGLSVLVGCLLGLSNFLLYGAVYAGNLSDPYPEAEYGYYFIYWLFLLTLALNVTYIVLLVRRKRDVLRQPQDDAVLV
jgi:hypothetical protein